MSSAQGVLKERQRMTSEQTVQHMVHTQWGTTVAALYTSQRAVLAMTLQGQRSS